MATDYSLELSTGLKPREALGVLVGPVSGLSWNKEESFLYSSTMNVGASEPRKSRQEAIEEGYGFVPTLLVGFRRAFDADYDEFYRYLLESVLLLLEHTQDSVLLFNGEITVMQRLGGRIAFNAETNPGRDEAWLRSRFPLPFECRPLRSPLVEG